MNKWLRIAVISSCTVSYMPPGGTFYRQHATVTLHDSRGSAIEAEVEYRAKNYHVDSWKESWMEWSGDFTRGVFLVHGETVEQLTFEPKTKPIVKTVQEPDGETPVTRLVEVTR